MPFRNANLYKYVNIATAYVPLTKLSNLLQIMCVFFFVLFCFEWKKIDKSSSAFVSQNDFLILQMSIYFVFRQTWEKQEQF